MDKLPLIFTAAVLIWLVGCDLGGGEPAMVSPDTPFIVGVLEVSPDTAIHHPQVFVGTLNDPQDDHYDLFADAEANLGRELFLPDFWAQVMVKSAFLHLRPLGEPDAEVTITGPLGEPTETTVALAHETHGAYGDLEHALPLVPAARYRLDVTWPNGRRYTAETHTPTPASITVPDTIRSPTTYTYHGPGDWTEIGEVQEFECDPDPDPASPVSIWSGNRDRRLDAETFVLESWQQLPFSDRGDHLRGSIFHIKTPSAYEDGMDCYDRWTAASRTSRWDVTPAYHRLAQLSDDLAIWYQPPFFEFTTSSKPDDILFDDPWYTAVIDARAKADNSRDQTYLPRISNIRPADGGPADAVGVFGGMTSRYLTRTLVPVRSFDPDTLDWNYHPDLR